MADCLKEKEMRKMVEDKKSKWNKMTSRILQVSLGTDNVFNTVYINNESKEESSYISQFTDEAKLLRKTSNPKDWKVTEWFQQHTPMQ